MALNSNKNKLSDSELENAYENIRKALAGLFLTDGIRDASLSIDILKKYYDKENPLLDINEPVKGMGTWTPLCVVAYYGFTKPLLFLLKNDANPNFSVDNEAIPLNIAAAKGEELCCLYLLNFGANINKQDKYGKTCFMRVCEQPNVKKTAISIFLDNQAGSVPDISILNIEGKSAIDIAKDNNNKDAMRQIEFWRMKRTLKVKPVENEKRIKI
jgi:ankyrin repeat protein